MAPSARTCPQCGSPVPATKRFCTSCGATVAAPPVAAPPVAAPVAPRAAPSAAPRAAPPAPPAARAPKRKRGVSSLWIVLPTLVYLAYQAYQIYRAFQAAGWDRHRIIPAAEVVALGVVLQFLKGRPWVSSGVRPFVPLVQPAVVFLFLGGDSTLLATIVIGFVMIVTQRSRLVPALEPWWGVQERIPALQRRVLSIAVPFAIGWWFGRHASGREWSRTALSMIFATTASFLLVFTPPHALRRRTPRKPA